MQIVNISKFRNVIIKPHRNYVEFTKYSLEMDSPVKKSHQLEGSHTSFDRLYKRFLDFRKNKGPKKVCIPLLEAYKPLVLLLPRGHFFPNPWK